MRCSRQTAGPKHMKGEEMQYSFSDQQQTIEWRHVVTGAAGQPAVLFLATEARRERTGFHAKIGISINNTSILGYDVFNVNRSEARTRLARKVHGRMDEQIQDAYPRAHVERDLDMFCLGLEKYWNTRLTSEALDGANVEPTVFALHPYIIEGGGTILYAPPGQGKSYVTLLMAQSIQHGINSLWEVGEPKKVLFVNLERSRQSVKRRIGHINTALGLGPEAQLHTVNARGATLQELEDTIRHAIKREGFEVLFLDSISRTARASLNEDTTANNIVNLLNSLADTWFAIGHTAKSQDTSKSTIFGSTHFEAGTDVAVRLESSAEESGMAVKLTVTKANDIRKPSPQVIFLSFDADGLIDAKPTSENDHPALMAPTGTSGGPTEADRVMEYLLAVGKASQQEISENTGVDQRHLTDALRKAGAIMTGKDGRRLVYGMPAVDPF